MVCRLGTALERHCSQQRCDVVVECIICVIQNKNHDYHHITFAEISQKLNCVNGSEHS
jgi:hypothetical protein